MRAVVVGAGIGGLAAAKALADAGLEVTVLERAPELRAAGYGLVLQANAVRALRRLGLEEQVASAGVRVGSAEIRTPTGALLVRIPFDELGWTVYGIGRPALQRVLVEAAPPVLLGNELVTLENVDADVVVGADGLRSTVRALLFGEEPLRYGHQRAWRASTAFPDLDRFVEVWGVGGGFGFGPMEGGRVYWYCFDNVPEAAPAPARPKDEFLRRYGTWFAPIPQLIEATDTRELESTLTYDRRPLTRWSRGRVTLLGDAAHPMKPNLGQGAAQALEDAVALADALRGEHDVERALRAYEHARVRLANAVVRASRQAAAVAEVRSPLAAWLRNAVFRALPNSFAISQQKKLLRL